MTLCIDFDGTIVDEVYPGIGPLRKDALYYLDKLHKDGHFIIIWTCRSGDQNQLMRDFLAEKEIKFNTINEPNPDLVTMYGNDSRKVGADLYIDDRGIRGLPSWEEIYHIIYHKTNEPVNVRPVPTTINADKDLLSRD